MEAPQNSLGSCRYFDPARYFKSLGKPEWDTLGMCVWKTNLSCLRAPCRLTGPHLPAVLSCHGSLQIPGFSLSGFVFVWPGRRAGEGLEQQRCAQDLGVARGPGEGSGLCAQPLAAALSLNLSRELQVQPGKCCCSPVCE